jgi:hypothetical protein
MNKYGDCCGKCKFAGIEVDSNGKTRIICTINQVYVKSTDHCDEFEES